MVNQNIAPPSISNRVNQVINDLTDLEIPAPGCEEDGEIWAWVDPVKAREAMKTLREAQDALLAAERRIGDKLLWVAENH
jgi:hypothetical protein